jgi:cyclophilin family peptidyl-prolyl cis-trans isomerase
VRQRPALAAILLIAGTAAASVGSRSAHAQSAVSAAADQSAAARVHAVVDPVIEALWNWFDRDAAFEHVRFISRFWRLPGNPGYDASLDRLFLRMSRDTAPPAGAGGLAVHAPKISFATGPAARGWEHDLGTLALVREGQDDDVVLSRAKERLALCINSFSTPPEGVTAPVVDVGRGDRDEDYAGKDLKGAIVLGDADAGQLWRRGVAAHGAIGVVSTALPGYINPDPPGAPPTPRDEWDILQWSSIPYDEARKGFGFKASPRAAARLRAAIRAHEGGRGPLVRVTINSTFTTRPVRTLVVEFPGATAPDERVVMAAHVQEPGANDNASGAATLAELVVSLSRAISRRQIAPPARTLTFLFLNEISGSRQWLQENAEAARHVKYMFSLDMTGEDVARTGGSFLVERYPDPNAVWDRPWDPHSEWGRGNVRAEQLKGDLINDVHLAVAARVARKSGWVVRSNPYEGGSDHTVFQSAGIPSVLDWHFTDRYYHTNFDTPDKTSAVEMRNVAVAVGATAWLFASATEPVARDIAAMVAAAGRDRLALEEREGAELASNASDAAAARRLEATILAAWRKWYAEAVRSVSRLVVGSPSTALGRDLEQLAGEFERRPGRGAVAPAAPAFSVVRSPGDDAQLRQSPDSGPLAVCGEDQKLSSPLPERWDAVVLAGDSRGYAPCEGVHDEKHREIRELVLLVEGTRSREPEIRRLAAQALGRMQLRIMVAATDEEAVQVATPGRRVVIRPPGGAVGPRTLLGMLTDEVPAVRRAAAQAVGDALAGIGSNPTEVERAAVDVARRVLLSRIGDGLAAPVIYETLGRLPYGDDATRNEIELLLTDRTRIDGSSASKLGAMKGLELLFRQNPKRPISEGTRERLRELAMIGPVHTEVPTRLGRNSAPAAGPEDDYARIRRLAMIALQTARDDDPLLLERVATDRDWQVRRLVAARLNLQRPEHAGIAERLRLDSAFQVRYELLAAVGREAVRTRQCAALVRAFDDPSPVVVMRAIDLMLPDCTDGEEGIGRLATWAESLRLSETGIRWHVPARALVALARLHPGRASEFVADAKVHSAWQVRVAAANAAAELRDLPTLTDLSEADQHHNVRTAALDAMRRMAAGRQLHEKAIEALRANDYQLVMTAANLLRGVAAELRDDAVTELLGAFRRLTGQRSDTSRDPRVAILERLGEVLSPDRAPELLPVAQSDFDPDVRAAARQAFEKVNGNPGPEPRSVQYRYPYQPRPETMASLPTRALLEVDGGRIEVELFVDQAPVTVARFAEAVRARRYNNRTFHRMAPNFVIQGGSPNANEYSGASRYMRDETGLPHLRGSVGISTRGRDTGDEQIFIDLVDVPRLDHQYTVFGRVLTGYDVLDGILEGARIRAITLK